jgi:hypothetical protein
MSAPVTTKLRQDPPSLHGQGNYFGLGWPALEWIERTVTPEMTTLETGSGGSTIVFAAAGSDHTAISPAAEEHERLAAWCEHEGISTERVHFIAEPSHEALLRTWYAQPLDLVLIDGAHGFPYPALDWFLTAQHLKIGGHVVLDDAFLPSVNMVVRYLRDSADWEMLPPLGYRTVAFRKLGDDISFDWLGSRFDRRPRFDYLKPGPRLVALARHHLIDTSPRGARLLARVRRGRGRA